MKFGVPVVATPVAVEGMHGQDGMDCMVANNPDDFARKIVQLHEDCDLWHRLVAGGRKNMIDHFSIETARPIMLEVGPPTPVAACLASSFPKRPSP